MANAKTILVVDDDYELSDGLRTVLEKQGYRVLQARDGQQGQQMIYQQHPDLVVLDMMMPRRGGYPVNPNGSQDDIAGVCNEDGNVFGLMPHPEHAVDPLTGSTDGLRIFESIRAHVEQRVLA